MVESNNMHNNLSNVIRVRLHISTAESLINGTCLLFLHASKYSGYIHICNIIHRSIHKFYYI